MSSQNSILLASARWTIVGEERQLCLDVVGGSDMTVGLAYLAHGGANIVFTMGITPNRMAGTDHASLQGKVLRVRKQDLLAGQKDTFTPREICHFVNDAIQPVLHPWVMPHSLINITRALVGRLSAALPVMVTGTRLSESDTESEQSQTSGPETFSSETTRVQAILLPDMRSSHDARSLLLEVKPKWLVQSPTAPQGARRCRTCAKQASEGKARTTQHCPLALLSGQAALIAPVIADLCNARGIVDFGARRALAEFFVTGNEGNKILQRLATLQRQFDPEGILVCEQDESSLRSVSTAMTLRDCSLYLTISHSASEALPVGSSAVGVGLYPVHTNTKSKFRDHELEQSLPVALPSRSTTALTLDSQAAVEQSVPQIPLMMPSNTSISITPILADLDPKHLSKAEYWAALERRLIDNGHYLGHEVLDNQEQQHTSCMLWSTPK